MKKQKYKTSQGFIKKFLKNTDKATKESSLKFDSEATNLKLKFSWNMLSLNAVRQQPISWYTNKHFKSNSCVASFSFFLEKVSDQPPDVGGED